MISHDLPCLSLRAYHCVPNNAKKKPSLSEKNYCWVQGRSKMWAGTISDLRLLSFRKGWASLNWDEEAKVRWQNPPQTPGEPANRKSPGPESSWRSEPGLSCCEVPQCHPVKPLHRPTQTIITLAVQHSTFSFNFLWPPPPYLVISQHKSVVGDERREVISHTFTRTFTWSNVSVFESNICKEDR